MFSRGRPDAEVMVVGEGPGAEEDRLGQPFVGPSGQLLDRMLAAGGLTERVFVTNTVFWRAPANRTPSPQEQAVCLPFLERAIALVRPRVLLLMGGASAKFLLKRPEGILKPARTLGALGFRGREHHAAGPAHPASGLPAATTCRKATWLAGYFDPAVKA